MEYGLFRLIKGQISPYFTATDKGLDMVEGYRACSLMKTKVVWLESSEMQR